jgi:microcystin-dependent protein
MSFWKWSRTASSNASADGSVNWAEGQAPSSVNDSARAMMAAAAKYRDDIAGAIATGGTSTAYTVTSYQAFDTLAHMDGAMIAFTPHATNGATVTLNVDGLGAKALRSAPGAELPAGVLVQGTPYAVTYNNSDGAFYLQGFFGNPYNIPIGGFMPYCGTSAPNSSFVFPFGQAISRTTYATFFGVIGTTFGSGDGSTTFNVPDLRGRIPAGRDDMGGSAASRIGTVATDNGTIVGTTLGSTGGSATHMQATGEVGQHAHGVTDTHGHVTTLGTKQIQSGAGVIVLYPDAATGPTGEPTTSTTGSISVNNNPAPAPMAWLQPTIVLNYILRAI